MAGEVCQLNRESDRLRPKEPEPLALYDLGDVLAGVLGAGNRRAVSVVVEVASYGVGEKNRNWRSNWN